MKVEKRKVGSHRLAGAALMVVVAALLGCCVPSCGSGSQPSVACKNCETAPGKISCVPVNDPGYGCGSQSCVPCVVPNAATAVCRPDGTCGVGACFPGFADCDQNSSNGCEVDIATGPNHC